MPALALPSPPLLDLPLCFPGRDCVDVPPLGAQAMYVVGDLTAASPGIAAALWAALGAALLLLAADVRRHWRGADLRPWSVLLAAVLVLGGLVTAWLMHGWLGEAALVYGGGDGRPAAAAPSTVIASWPLVQAGARAAMLLGALTLFLMLNTAAVRRKRAARSSTAQS